MVEENVEMSYKYWLAGTSNGFEPSSSWEWETPTRTARARNTPTSRIMMDGREASDYRALAILFACWVLGWGKKRALPSIPELNLISLHRNCGRRRPSSNYFCLHHFPSSQPAAEKTSGEYYVGRIISVALVGAFAKTQFHGLIAIEMPPMAQWGLGAMT